MFSFSENQIGNPKEISTFVRFWASVLTTKHLHRKMTGSYCFWANIALWFSLLLLTGQDLLRVVLQPEDLPVYFSFECQVRIAV